MRHLLLTFTTLALLLINAASLTVAESPHIDIPEQLRPWVEWVSERHPVNDCLNLRGAARCAWPAHLALDVGEKGGSFSLTVTVKDDRTVNLPGSVATWPLDVRVSSDGEEKPATVTGATTPSLFLRRGSHILRGNFRWDKMPEELVVPDEVALLEMSINGLPRQDLSQVQNGKVSLRALSNGDNANNGNAMALRVFRRFSDGIPFEVATRVRVDASNTAGRLLLRDPSPQGTRLVGINTTVPHYTSPNNEFAFVLTPGAHDIEFISVGARPLTEIAFAPQVELWPTEETWLWKEDRQIRIGSMVGGTPVEASMMQVDEDWANVPAFLVTKGQTVTINGQPSTSAGARQSAVTVERTIVQDTHGAGFTITDSVVGTLGGSGRLDMMTPYELGRVELNQTPRLITLATDSGHRGVEIRDTTFNVTTLSRLEGAQTTVPAVGWDRDADWLKVTILSPPGRELLWASGADDSIGTRLSAWSLSTAFILALVTIVTSVVFGVGVGITAGLCFALIHGENSNLMELILLAVLAVPIIRSEALDKRLGFTYIVLVTFISVQAYHQISTDVVSRLYPDTSITQPTSTSHVAATSGSVPPGCGGGAICYYDDRVADSVDVAMTHMEGSFGALIMAAAGIMSLVFLVLQRAKWALLSLSVAISFFVLRSLIATFFSDVGIASFSLSNEIAYDRIANERGLERRMKQDYSNEGEGTERNMSVAGAPRGDSSSTVAPPSEAVDPGQRTVQVGPGLPTWRGGQAVILSWTGPVPKTHQIHLHYLPYWLGLVLVILKGFLIGFLMLTLWREVPLHVRGWIRQLSGKTACVCLLALAPLVDVKAQEPFPPSALLDELEARVTARRDAARICSSDCVSTESALLSVSPTSITLKAKVHSVGENGWAIPSAPGGSLFHSITIDGKPIMAARREGDVTWILVPDGIHSVEAKGTAPRGDVLSITFQHSVGTLGVEAPGFKHSVHREQTYPVVQLLRNDSEVGTKSGEDLRPLTEPWYTVSREVVLFHKGSTETVINRFGMINREDAISVPRLATERIWSGDRSEEGNSVLVRFGPGETKKVLRGTLDLDAGSIRLEAKGGDRYSEKWHVFCSDVWRCQFDGVKPTEVSLNGVSSNKIQPRPGDTTVVRFDRPEGARGTTSHVQKAVLNLSPSTHFLRGETIVQVISGQNVAHQIPLPEGATVREILLDGRDIADLVDMSARPLQVPTQKGAHTYKVVWQTPQEMSWLPKIPSLSVEGPFTNGIIQYELPPGWSVLWTSSSPFGPRVTLWASLVVAMVGFIIFNYFFKLPCSRRIAIPLFAGAWCISPQVGLMIAAWLFLSQIILTIACTPESSATQFILEKRIRREFYVILALPLVGISCLLLGAFTSGMELGISGYGSSPSQLVWYIDRGVSSMAAPSVVAIPPWAWRSALFVWGVVAALLALSIARRVFYAVEALPYPPAPKTSATNLDDGCTSADVQPLTSSAPNPIQSPESKSGAE